MVGKDGELFSASNGTDGNEKTLAKIDAAIERKKNKPKLLWTEKLRNKKLRKKRLQRAKAPWLN